MRAGFSAANRLAAQAKSPMLAATRACPAPASCAGQPGRMKRWQGHQSDNPAVPVGFRAKTHQGGRLNTRCSTASLALFARLSASSGWDTSIPASLTVRPSESRTVRPSGTACTWPAPNIPAVQVGLSSARAMAANSIATPGREPGDTSATDSQDASSAQSPNAAASWHVSQWPISPPLKWLRRYRARRAVRGVSPRSATG